MIKEKLIAAKALIDTPEKWTTRAYYRNAVGLATDADNAVCFCSIGALRHTIHDSSFWTVRRYLAGAMEGEIVDFNDTQTHAEVMAAWDRAIEAAT